MPMARGITGGIAATNATRAATPPCRRARDAYGSSSSIISTEAHREYYHWRRRGSKPRFREQSARPARPARPLSIITTRHQLAVDMTSKYHTGQVNVAPTFQRAVQACFIVAATKDATSISPGFVSRHRRVSFLLPFFHAPRYRSRSKTRDDEDTILFRHDESDARRLFIITLPAKKKRKASPPPASTLRDDDDIHDTVAVMRFAARQLASSPLYA